MDRTLRRKLQELILAGRIERQYSKDRILELYLTKVYFGDGLYGVEAASRGFFAKHAADLGRDRRRTGHHVRTSRAEAGRTARLSSSFGMAAKPASFA